MTLPAGLFATPYAFQEVDPAWNTLLLDTLAQHPQWVYTPSTEAERRVTAAAVLTSPDNLIWGVWRHGELLGVLYLGKIVRGLDATLHVLFFDRNLVGKRALLHRFIGFCFTEPDLAFRRLSVEVPEDADKLLRFYRKFGFRFEGETRATGLVPTAFLEAGAPGLPAIPGASRWIASQGSRVEGAFWRDGRWIDVLRLRLLRDEWGREGTDAAGTSSASSGGGRRSGRGGAPRWPVRGRGQDDSPAPAGSDRASGGLDPVDAVPSGTGGRAQHL